MAALSLTLWLCAQEWQIDPAHSAARHLMVATVRGHFGKLTGTVRWRPANPSSAAVQAELDVSTIDTGEPKRDAHLRSPDFFEAEKFPSMKFKSAQPTPAGQGRLRLAGDLTIRGVTRPLVFEVEGPPTLLIQGPGGCEPAPRQPRVSTAKSAE